MGLVWAFVVQIVLLCAVIGIVKIQGGELLWTLLFPPVVGLILVISMVSELWSGLGYMLAIVAVVIYRWVQVTERANHQIRTRPNQVPSPTGPALGKVIEIIRILL